MTTGTSYPDPASRRVHPLLYGERVRRGPERIGEIVTARLGHDRQRHHRAPGADGCAAVANGTDQIDVSWTASTDNVAVTGYHVFRDSNATAIATVTTGTSYPDPASRRVHPLLHRLALRRGPERIREIVAARLSHDRCQHGDDVHACGRLLRRLVTGVEATSAPVTCPRRRLPDARTYLKFTAQRAQRGTVNAGDAARVREPAQSTGYDVFGVSDTSWIERGAGGINFNNAPPLAATKTGSSGTVFAQTWTTVNVTPLVSGNGTITIALTTTNTIALAMQSRTGGTNPPQLVVTTS